MTQASSILLVDSNAGDSALSALLLQRAMPQARISPASDAMALAFALLGAPPEVAIVAADLGWARPGEVIATLKQQSPSTAVILLGHESDIVAHALNPGLACDGVVRKSVTGFLGLAAVVIEAAERSRRRAAPADGRSAQEMRDIALVISHDLKEPLQQIVRLARMGQAAGDPASAAPSFQLVLDSATRANTMLDGMLDYLRVAGRDTAPVAVDLNLCFARAMEHLRSLIGETHAEIRFAKLPMVMGDELQLVHLFQNLLSNALKFHSRDHPAIDVSVEPRDQHWLLTFRDNGIGIAPAFLERIFTMSQRLHTREEYPGTGIGLTLCRRIVERHGGRIWAESAGSGGSTFYVLLPQSGTLAPERT